MNSDAAIDAFKRGETAEARRLAEQRLALGERIGPRAKIAALCMLSRIALREGDFVDAANRADLAEQEAQQNDDPALLQEPVHLLAAVARLRGDLHAARQHYLTSIDLNVRLKQTKAVLIEQRNLAYVELHLGHLEEARRRFALAHEGATPDGAEGEGPGGLLDAAVLATTRRDLADAALLLAQTRSRYAELRTVPDPDEEQEMRFVQLLIENGSAPEGSVSSPGSPG